MSKYKIIFERDELKSCKRTTQFIGDKATKWENEFSIAKHKKQVIVLINANNTNDAKKNAQEAYNKLPSFHDSVNKN